MQTATITKRSDGGFFFAEIDETHESIFVHIKNVEKRRCLQPGDRVSLDIAPNPRKAGEVEGINVKFIGHVVRP